MNKIKIYVNADHTIKDIDPLGFIPANGNGSAVIEMIAPFLASHSIYAMYRKPNGLSPERLLTYLADYTEEVDGETWNVWLSGVPETVINIDSAVQQEFSVQLEDWFIEPEDGFLGIVQSSDDIPAFLVAEGITPVEGDFIRVVVTNTDWEYLSTVWTDSGERIAADESRVPVQLANLPVDPSITTTLPTVTPTNIELIISILNSKIGRVEAVARFVEQDLTTYVSVTAAEETDELYMLRAGVPKRITVSQIVAGGGGMTTAVYDVDENGIVDKAETLDDGAGNTLTAARAKIISDWMNQDLKTTASPTFVEINIGDTTLSYDAANRVATLDYGNGVMLQVGEESYVFAVNKDVLSDDLVEGQPASITGATGATPQFTGATTADDDLAHKTVGILTEDINFNAKGKITTFGLVRDINTTGASEGETWLEGDFLYVGEKALTNIEPVKPLPKVEVGLVLVSNANVGVIFVNVDKAHKLGYLSDVDTSTAIEGDILVKNVNNVYVPITYINRLLDGISDVNVPSPMLGEVLQWNGVEWVNGDIVTQGAGKSVTWFVEDTAAIPPIAGYELLSEIPLGLPEEDDSVVLSSALTDTLISSYATEVLGRTKIEAGSWNFETYARVSSANGITIIKFKVYSRATGGAETLLFESQTEEIDTVINQLYSIISVQSEFAILATDRIVVKYYGYTSSAANPVVTLVHSGTANATHIDTPLQTLHNDLAGLQGGNSTERYHMTLAELNRLNNDLVEKNLSSDITYPEQTAGGIVDKTKIFMFAYDENEPVEADRYKKMSVNENDTSANTASGAFVASGNYAPDGLGAYKSAVIIYHDMLFDKDGDYYVDIKTLETNTIMYVKFPVVTSTDPLRVSSYDKVTYNTVKLNGTSIPANIVSDLIVKLKYDGTTLSIDLSDTLEQNISYQAIADSTFGVVNPIDGGALMPLVKSVSVEQSIFEGDLATSLVINGTGQRISLKLDGTIYANTTYTTAEQTFDLVSGNKYLAIFKSSDGLHLLRDSITIAYSDATFVFVGPATDNFDEVRIEFTATKTLKANIKFAGSLLNSGTLIRDYQQLIPLTNKPYASDTLAQLNARFTSYIPQGINDISSLDLDSTGVNLFNVLDYDVDTTHSLKIRVKPSIDYVWSESIEFKLYDIDLNLLHTATATAFITSSETAYISFINTIATPSDFILNQGTLIEDWVEHNSSNFTVPTGISVGTSQDETKWVNDHYELERKNGLDLTVIKGATFIASTTGTTYNRFVSPSFATLNLDVELPLNNNFDGVADFIIDGQIYRNTNATATTSPDANPFSFAVEQSGNRLAVVDDSANISAFLSKLSSATVVEFRYKVNTPTTETVDSDGSVIQEKVTTLIQNGLWGLDYDVTYNLNSTAQIGTNFELIRGVKLDQDLLQAEQALQGARLTVNEADIVDLKSSEYNIELFTTDLVDGPTVTSVRKVAYATNDKVVTISGRLEVNTSLAVLFTGIPVAYRPTSTLTFSGIEYTADRAVNIIVNTSGEISTDYDGGDEVDFNITYEL